jgi:putative membrane protein insertion efficiency factor
MAPRARRGDRAEGGGLRVLRELGRAPAVTGLGLVYAYRYTLGALFPATCKYHPSCSQYALDAIRKYGLVRGTVRTGWRLLRCNPWSHGGVDPA